MFFHLCFCCSVGHENESMAPPPRTVSPWYNTMRCPGVIALCGSSKVIRTAVWLIEETVAFASFLPYLILA